MKLKELCVDERPREKMLSKGAGAMSNAELLAILIGSGTRKENVLEVANRLLAANEGKLSGIAGMDPCKMMAMDGIGKVRYSSIAAATVRSSAPICRASPCAAIYWVCTAVSYT